MPKQPEKLSQFLNRTVGMYSGILRTDGSVLYCTCCNIVVNTNRLFNVKQHISSGKHVEAAKRRETCNSAQQLFLKDCNGKSANPFNLDICSTFLEANIPLKKIRHESVKTFITKYTKFEAPSESALRKYIPSLYEDKIKFLQAKARNKYIWTSLDETTDAKQRYVANFVFGVLDGSPEEQNKCYLLNMAVLEKVNSNTVAAFYNDCLHILWPDGIDYSKVLLTVTDSASYMLAAMQGLQTLYPKMIHLTCFAHGLHRLAEFIRSQFKAVNNLISATKAVFVKAPARRKKFKEMFPDINLPPTPVITRWGTWIHAAEYYCENFDEIKTVLQEFDEDDSEAIKEAKILFASINVKNDLAFIKTNFKCIRLAIAQLETRGLPLKDSLNIFHSICDTMKELNDKKYANKMDLILRRNPGFKRISAINQIINENASDGIPNNEMTPIEMANLKNAPVTSCDVERIFSIYGSFLTCKRTSFLFENLKMHMIVHCNRKIDEEDDELLEI